MNYTTLKKGLLSSLVVLVGTTGLANAQKEVTSAKAQTKTVISTPKVFGGSGQYRTWSVGVHAGILAPTVLTGGSSDYTNWTSNLGYGLLIRKQLGHAFGLELNATRGLVGGTNVDAKNGVLNGIKDYETSLAYAFDVRAIVNVATVDFLRRENSVNFTATLGYGRAGYATKFTKSDSNIEDLEGKYGANSNNKYAKTMYIPVGAGVKFKVSDRVAFNLNYVMNFVDGDNFDATDGETVANKAANDKFSYTSVGLEYSLGSKSKPNLDWVNPLAMMYDELKDESIKKELKALKDRVQNLESAVENLKKDTDGDGVSDQFDKCPGTEANVAVDGAGCPLPKFEAPAIQNTAPAITGWESVQFEFQSAVLKTEAYPILEKLALSLKEKGTKILIKGHASDEGSATYNMKLSKDRAESVKTFLINSGVPANKVTSKGFGETSPVASNDTEEGRSRNRRVESTQE
ncbi:MAG: OmpA family protein [Sphingobacteriaceae bacterium]|nr:OmpA family protein [Sphingobacteriaceae bacterium]